jgi:methionine synthase II (cobalamin-independent)
MNKPHRRNHIMKLRFHAEHIGSLLRPQYLVDAKTQAKNNSIPPEELTAAEHKAISSVVQTQLSKGIRSICSGEYDRNVYFGGFFEKLQGFEVVADPPWDLYRMSAPPIRMLRDAGLKFPMAVICTGKIKHVKSPYLEKWKYLRSCVPKKQWRDCKFTMPPAPFFHLRLAPGKCYPNDVYSSDEEYFADLALAYQAEFRALYHEGCRSIQIDDPTLAYFCSQDMIDGLEAAGVDSDALFQTYLKAHNECLKGKPDDLEVGLHICRGLSTSP